MTDNDWIELLRIVSQVVAGFVGYGLMAAWLNRRNR